MKKWFLFGLSTLTLTLAACSAETVQEQRSTIYEVNADVLTLEEKKEQKKQQELEEKHAIHYAQLYNALNEAVTSLGIAQNAEAAAGVYYAELADFNNDGFEELYILLKNDGKAFPNTPHRTTTSYVHEIWTNNGEQQLPALSYSSVIPPYDADTLFNVSLVRGETSAFITELKASVNEATSTEKIVLLQKDSATASEQIFSKQNNEAFINNKPTEAAAFIEARKAYSGQAVKIVESNIGASNYSITTADINALLQKLQSGAQKDYISK